MAVLERLQLRVGLLKTSQGEPGFDREAEEAAWLEELAHPSAGRRIGRGLFGGVVGATAAAAGGMGGGFRGRQLAMLTGGGAAAVGALGALTARGGPNLQQRLQRAIMDRDLEAARRRKMGEY